MTSPFIQRIYCVPCHDICPYLTLQEQEAWMHEHTKAKHLETGPMTKGQHFATVPSTWG